ncbi:MAG: hypothetical protein EXR12_04705 [Rhodospirillaceae bacterium]|nr:hypothetical protein [Rhodospirillaceae bacterium]
MDYAVIISAIVLGLSVLATAAKFLDWFIHSDPQTMIRVSRWMLLLLVFACIPVLVWMIAGGRWPGAMLLGAGMLIVPTFLKWRAMLDRLRPKARPFDMDVAPDAETVQRAAAILEAYVQHALVQRALPAPPQDGMSRAEALDVLGLAPGADEAAIRAAHRRLASLVHPDHSGSTYLMNKVDQARDTLLRPAREWPRLSKG